MFKTTVTCMDARINPFEQLGFSEGDAHIIRNAGGMAKDAIRSLVISQRLLGTRNIAVYHHTGCGMVTFRGPELKQLVKWARPDSTACAEQVDAIDFLEFTDLEQSVKDDVNFLKESPLILEETKITGWIHHLETGEVFALCSLSKRPDLSLADYSSNIAHKTQNRSIPNNISTT
ncbi:carbonic anhydrase [Mycena metata]|uniref:Carbonic anhydrase n=1 Tax=Mycena metata TaxID=1033252 RepID=A0AAD7KHG9_9AGAR|nr:carbonic anhydrase [Mycena metata]